jgi:hypothetical protein
MQIDQQSLFLSSRLTNSITDPFFCFSSSDYLPTDLYTHLSKTFPDEHYFVQEDGFGKKAFSSREHQELLNEFTLANPVWAEFLEKLSSDSMIKDIRKNCMTALLRSRGVSGAKLWRRQNESSRIGDGIASRGYNKILRTLTEQIEVQFQFSALSKGAYVPPHTDGKKKLVSLLIYFPPDDWKPEYCGDSVFYVPSDARREDAFDNYSVEFGDGLKEFYRVPYQNNVLCGFVKSRDSWHAVDRLKLPDGVIRRSLNINIMKKYY